MNGKLMINNRWKKQRHVFIIIRLGDNLVGIDCTTILQMKSLLLDISGNSSLNASELIQQTQQQFMLMENQQSSSPFSSIEGQCSSSKDTESTEAVPDLCNFQSNEFSCLGFRPQLFQFSADRKEISQKVHQRSVSWIITICWSKDLSQECFWLTLLLYYAFKAQRSVSKENLELILLSCLSLALKMTTSKVFHIEELCKLASRQMTNSEIACMEAEICQVVNYNLIIPHQLEGLSFSDSFLPDQQLQLLFLCEILMIKDSDIFMNEEKLKDLIKLVLDREMNKQLELYVQLRDLLKLKESRIVISKYSSKIDVSKLQENFL